MTTPETPSASPPRGGDTSRPAQPARRHPWLRRFVRRALLWLPVAATGALLGLSLALAVALWVWSGTAGSFEQALRWAQTASERYPATLGELRVELDAAASHRLTEGGPVRRLQWSRDGLGVQVDDLDLRWPGLLPALLSGQGVVIERLAAQAVRVEDRRPPQPDSPPLTELPLPLPVDLPFSLAAVHYQGAITVSASELNGRYRYQDERHSLQLDGLRWADGHYRGLATLEARAPLPLDLRLDGDIRVPVQAGLAPQTVSARARVQGTLSAPDATLRVEADAPQLQASATVRPWLQQPLERADVRMERFNVAQFWPAGPSTRLTGHITAQPLNGQDGALWQATAALTNTQDGPWDRQQLPVQRLNARVEQLPASAQGRPWRLAELDATVAGGPLTGRGEVLLPAAGGPPLQWDGQIRWRGWRPDALLSHLPPQTAELDARAHDLKGNTRVELTARAAQAQLDAQGRLDARGQGFDGQATLAVPGARARFDGRMAARDGTGSLQLDLTQAEGLLAWVRGLLPRGATVPVLDTLRAQGAATAQVRWRGGWQNLAALEFDAQASTAGLTLGTEAGTVLLDTALQASRHRGPISVTTERLRAQARIAGAPEAWSRWQLQSAAAVRATWGSDGLAVDTSRWTLRPPVGNQPLDVQIEPLRWRTQGPGAGLTTRGQLAGIPLAWMDTLPQQPLREAGLSTDLLVDAHWDIAWPQDTSLAPRALLRLERRGGDLQWRADAHGAPLAAGVRQLAATLELEGERLKAQAQWDSERAGRADATVESRLSRRDGLPAWDADAPLNGSLTARLPQMGVWSVLAPPGWRVAGSLSAEAQISGTRVAPRFNGSLSANELSARSVVDGIEFTNGRLLARLQGERIAIETLELEGSGGAANGGKLSATGAAEWVDVAGKREPRMTLQVKADQLRASTRADRRLTVSGQLDAALAGTQLKLTGDARVDQALFLLPDETTPTLGDDVVVRGRTTSAATRAARVVPDVNVNLDLGRRFEVRGHGLQARLTGRLNVRSNAERPTPQVLGEVRTASGSYQAYGQRLDIEEGVLRFTGPYDNPSLDVLAIRPYTTQRVGVQVRGTARVPQVRLYSEPDLPDSEKLAWLVLGRPATGGGAEAAVLQQAAMALLSGGNGPTLGQRLGLDELSVRGASSTPTGDATTSSAALTLGKRLSNRLYVSYERSLAGALGTFAMFYDISRRLTLRARAGEDNAVDLIFTVSYD